MSGPCNECLRLTEVCYYVTGHGLGHATRSLQLISGLLKSGKFIVHTISQVNSDFFVHNLHDFGISTKNPACGHDLFTHYNRTLDSGAVQTDVFVVDALGSLEKYLVNTHQHREQLIADEVKWLKDKNIKLVLVDATPLGCVVGHLAGATTILVSNFSWDFCYKGMLQTVVEQGICSAEQIAQFEDMVRQCEEDSSACDVYLQLPGATPVPTNFTLQKLKPGPLIARTLQHPEYRATLNIPAEAKVLLLGFGGQTTEWHLKDEFLPAGWICLVLGAGAADMPSARFQAMPFDVYVPDLIYLADVVLGKLGYGFVSECLTLNAPLIYVPRQNWPEEAYLEKLLTDEYRAGVCMPKEDFVQGNWGTYIDKAALLKHTWRVPQDQLNAADTIVAFVSSIL